MDGRRARLIHCVTLVVGGRMHGIITCGSMPERNVSVWYSGSGGSRNGMSTIQLQSPWMIWCGNRDGWKR